MLAAGDLDTRVTFQRKSATVDADSGRDIVTWVDVATVWAQVQDVLPSRSEAVRQGLEVAKNQTRIRTRYRSDIDSAMRVVVQRREDVTYQIVGGPAELGRREGLEIVCERYST